MSVGVAPETKSAATAAAPGATPEPSSEPASPPAEALSLAYLVPEFPGQTHVFFWREASALRRLGVEVHWLSTRRPTAECRHAFARDAAAATTYLFPPRWGEAAVELIRRPAGVFRALRYIASLRAAGRKGKAKLLAMLPIAAGGVAWARRRGVGRLHAHSCADAAHLAALMRRLGGPRYSLTLHGDLEVYGADHGAKFRDAEFVSTVTAALREQVLGLGAIAAERVPVLWMGVDTARFTPAEPADATPGRLRLVTIARLQANKGHRFALRAIRRLIDRGLDVTYDLAGQGPDRDAIEREIAELGLVGRVTLHGTVGEDDVLAMLRRADAFVLPSVGLGEACPVSVMEAMSCGLPVVCSIIGGVPDMYDHGREGCLVPQADVDGLAAAFAELANDPERRRDMGVAGRERAVAAFDATGNAARLRRLLSGDLGGDLPGAAT